MSGRIGDWKTLGSGCVEPLALPSADRIVTVGREAIVMELMGFCRGGGIAGRFEVRDVILIL
jgi:hypothetical protein